MIKTLLDYLDLPQQIVNVFGKKIKSAITILSYFVVGEMSYELKI